MNYEKKIIIDMFIFSFIFLIIFNIFKSNVNLIDNIYISFGSSNTTAKVLKTELSEEQIIEEYKDYEYVKVDKIVDIKTLSYEKFKEKINDNEVFNYGIVLDNNRIVLLSEELNANNIIDRKEKNINFKNLNSYLAKKGISKKFNSISKITIFKTESKYLYNNEFIDLENKMGFNNRNIENIKSELPTIIESTGKLLASMNKKGKYVYGYSTNTAKEINSYNILRHAGSTWSLILYYKEYSSDELKTTIQESIDY